MQIKKKHQKKTIFLRIGITIFIASRLGVVSYFGYGIYQKIFHDNNIIIEKPKKNLTFLKGEINGISYRAFDSHVYDIRLFLNNDEGQLLSNFNNLQKYIHGKIGKKLLFATNAGMFHPDMKPVGLHIANGVKIKNVELANGDGNFYLKPNGIFFIDKYGNASVMETQNFLFFRGNKIEQLKLATQSGPLLLQNGKIHHSLNPTSLNKFIRSGVGVKDGKTYFVISNDKVTFYEFALFFKDKLGIKNALYLDGGISDGRWKGKDIFKGKESFVGMIGVLDRERE